MYYNTTKTTGQELKKLANNTKRLGPYGRDSYCWKLK